MSNELTKEGLEYVAFVAPKFCNEFGDEYDSMAISHVTNLFCSRLRSEDADLSKICSPEKKELYLSDHDLQTSLTEYGLDPEKFWLLILFLADLTNTFYGEFLVFEDTTIKDKISKMEKMVEDSTCKMTLDNGEDSVTIDLSLFDSELRSFVHALAGAKVFLESYKATEFKTDERPPHKIKTFMDMLDYFLNNYNETYLFQRKGRKDWLLTAKILYLVGFYGDESFFSDSEGSYRNSLKYVGKEIKDMTKNCADSAHRENSCYMFIPY